MNPYAGYADDGTRRLADPSPPPLQHPMPQHPPAPMPPSGRSTPHSPPSGYGAPPHQASGASGYAAPGTTHPVQGYPPQGPQAGQSQGGQYGAPPPGAGSHFQAGDFAQQFGFQDFGQAGAATQLGMQFGKSAMQAGQQYMEQNINRYVPMSSLKYYWNVNTAYVWRKIRLLLFPFRHKSWNRQGARSEENGQLEGYKPPREDVNAPDMYIPGKEERKGREWRGKG